MAQHTIVITNSAIEPGNLSVNCGDEITWTCIPPIVGAQIMFLTGWWPFTQQDTRVAFSNTIYNVKPSNEVLIDNAFNPYNVSTIRLNAPPEVFYGTIAIG